jgi:hypothetical protein
MYYIICPRNLPAVKKKFEEPSAKLCRMAQVTRTKMHVVIYTQLANGTLIKLVGVHEYACIHSCLQFF